MRTSDRSTRSPRLRPIRLRFAAALLVTLAATAGARDFPQPLDLGNPFMLPEGSNAGRLLHGFHGDVAYHDYTFVDGPHDLFSIRQRTTVGLFRTALVAASLSYHTFLMVGPVVPGQDAFSVAEWNMNAIQFEYGLTAAVKLPWLHARGAAVTLEYGRTSQHPLRSGYSEVSSDIVEVAAHSGVWRVGGGAPGFGPVALVGALRVAHVDLWDLWQSPLLSPRSAVRVELPLETEAPLEVSGGRRQTASIVARVWPRVLVMRDEGVWPYADTEPGVQMEVDAEVGVRVAGRSAVEMVVEVFATRDTEQVRGEAAPLVTVGMVFRAGR